MKRIALMLAAVLASFSAWALDLETAKSQGLVGEQPNGYLGLVVTNAEAAKLINDINSKRKQKYTEIAAKQKTTLSNIENIAGSKLIERAQKDKEYYKTADGKWAR